MESNTRIYSWYLYFGLDNRIHSATLVYNPAFDGKINPEELYTGEEVDKLNCIVNYTDIPTFSENAYEAHEQLINLSMRVRYILNNNIRLQPYNDLI